MNRTDYCGNIVYENDTLKRVLIDGGYITFAHTKGGSLSAPQYHFYVKDHLGNNRVVVNGSGKIEETNNYYPYGGLMADNTNVKSVQPYKYVGKELDGMFGWYMLDHGARWYDAASIVWRNMDRLAEHNFSYSPYMQSHDNPVSRLDEDGKTDYYFNEKGQMHIAHNFNNFIETIKIQLGGSGRPDRIINENNQNCIVSLPHGTIQKFTKRYGYTSFEVKNKESANIIFNALVKNTDVEWASVKHGKNGKYSYTFVTDGKPKEVSTAAKFMTYYEHNGEHVYHMLHNHPFTIEDRESNFGDNVHSYPSDADMETAKRHPRSVFFIYNMVDKKVQYYDKEGIYKEGPLPFLY